LFAAITVPPPVGREACLGNSLYYTLARRLSIRVHQQGLLDIANDGALPLAARSVNRLLGAQVVRVIPRDHRFVASANDDVERVRDLTGTIGKLFD
jgi:hypothetical protein